MELISVVGNDEEVPQFALCAGADRIQHDSLGLKTLKKFKWPSDYKKSCQVAGRVMCYAVMFLLGHRTDIKGGKKFLRMALILTMIILFVIPSFIREYNSFFVIFKVLLGIPEKMLQETIHSPFERFHFKLENHPKQLASTLSSGTHLVGWRDVGAVTCSLSNDTAPIDHIRRRIVAGGRLLSSRSSSHLSSLRMVDPHLLTDKEKAMRASWCAEILKRYKYDKALTIGDEAWCFILQSMVWSMKGVPDLVKSQRIRCHSVVHLKKQLLHHGNASADKTKSAVRCLEK
ncbi:hypothetical protein AAG570_006402 [Ranatra chinensis]|uniref:Uncharacterized protein n=1 Tax=Ranatra chinensis TaxID=642074 RepID=A0ABD0ZF54_9HEMI